MASLGSGWGDKISILQHSNNVEIERVLFTPRELQPLINNRYSLDGSTTENTINIGRGNMTTISSTKWENNKLVITTLFPYQDPNSGKWHKSKMIQTLWLEEPTKEPWEPNLIIETYREAVLGGLSSTNRTIYTKGYR